MTDYVPQSYPPARLQTGVWRHRGTTRQGRLRVVHFAASLHGTASERLLALLIAQASVYGQDNVTVIAPEPVISALSPAGARSIVLDLQLDTAFQFFAAQHKWLALTREMEMDVLHLHGLKAGLVGGLRAPRCRPAVIYCNQGAIPRSEARLWKRLLLTFAERQLSERADRIVAVSQAVLNEGIRAGISPLKYVLIQQPDAPAEGAAAAAGVFDELDAVYLQALGT